MDRQDMLTTEVDHYRLLLGWPGSGDQHYGDQSITPLGYLFIGLALFGAIILARTVYLALAMIEGGLSSRGRNLREFGAQRGAWALVTGCTDGIGKAFAEQLAAAGFHVLLVSRTPSKLDELARELRRAYSVKTKTVAIDFASATDADYDRLNEAIAEADYIGMLVNNVGVCHQYPVRFQDMDMTEAEDIVTVNVLAQIRVTKLVLPRLIAQRHGLVLNVGSFSALAATPYLSVYGGTKAWLRCWSQALAEEVLAAGVAVQYLGPFYIVSQMSGFRRPRFGVPSAAVYVQRVLGSIGVTAGSRLPYHSNPYLPHSFLECGADYFQPHQFTMFVAHTVAKMLYKRGLRKQARLANSQ